MAVSNFVRVFPQGITNLVSLLHYGTYARFMIRIPIGPFFWKTLWVGTVLTQVRDLSSLKLMKLWNWNVLPKQWEHFVVHAVEKDAWEKSVSFFSACWKCLTSASMFSISLDFLWSEHWIRALHWIIVLCCGIPRFVFVQKVIFNQLNNLTLMELWRLILTKHRQRFSREHFSRSFGSRGKMK